MATYTVEAPDGKKITLEGPDGASHADVLAQAQQLYNPKAAAPKPVTIRPQDAQTGLDRGSATLEAKIKNLPEAAKAQARQIYFDRTADLRVASATSASSKRGAQMPQQRVQNSAQQRTRNNTDKTGNFFTALKSGITRGAFGLPERLAAAGERFLPSAITGNESDASYDQILEQIRANTDEDLEQSLPGNILGQIFGGLTGAAPARGVMALGSKIPGAAAAGQAALRAAPRATKVAALAAAGGAGGAAQALGEGSDVSTGATYGAIGGPLLVGLGKGAAWLTRPARDMFNMTKPDSLLRRFTDAKAEDIQRAADEYRQTTGSEPTLFEVLPLADRNKIRKEVVGRSPGTSEQAVEAVQRRINAVGPEMAATTRGATADRRVRVLTQMQADAEEALQRTDAAPQPRLDAATQGPLPMSDRTRAIDAEIMDPVRGMPVADDVNALMPTTLVPNANVEGQIDEVISDPEMARAIQDAAGTKRLRQGPDSETADITGLTANDAAEIIINLSKKKAGQDGYAAAQRGIDHMFDVLEERAPQASEAIQRMRAAHAANKRVAEGLEEGAQTRTRSTAPIGREQPVRNAYDTPEGTQGRFLGQINRLAQDFNGTPNEALRQVDQIAGSGTVQDALAGNLGRQEGAAISTAAEAQARGVRNLAAVSKETGADAETLGLADLAKGLLGMSPSSMVTTKIAALSRMLTLTRIPEKKARAVVDMLFSQNPAMTNRAIGLLNSAGRDGKAFLDDLGKSVNIGARAGQLGQEGNDTPVDTLSVIPEASAEEVAPDDALSDEMNPETGENIPQADIDAEIAAGNVPYGRAVVEALFPEAYITDDERDPDSALGRKNPGSYHVKTDEAVDVRPIPGMTFEEFIQTIRDGGYEIVEAIDEVKNPSGHATGPHWHVVIG